jgi:hypothetical protein
MLLVLIASSTLTRGEPKNREARRHISGGARLGQVRGRGFSLSGQCRLGEAKQFIHLSGCRGKPIVVGL